VSNESDMLLCEVFCSPRRAQTYLYVDRSEGTERVPQELLQGFGEPQSVLTLKLHAGRRLASADAARVLHAIREQGYYLQVPPSVAIPVRTDEGELQGVN
jgi:uncharacterized protein YcgL (UPF0745 family)